MNTNSGVRKFTSNPSSANYKSLSGASLPNLSVPQYVTIPPKFEHYMNWFIHGILIACKFLTDISYLYLSSLWEGSHLQLYTCGIPPKEHSLAPTKGDQTRQPGLNVFVKRNGRKRNQQEKTKPDRLQQRHASFTGGNNIHSQLSFYLLGTTGPKAKIQILKIITRVFLVLYPKQQNTWGQL